MLGVGCMALTGLMRLHHGGKLVVRAGTGLVALFRVYVPARLPAGPEGGFNGQLCYSLTI